MLSQDLHVPKTGPNDALWVDSYHGPLLHIPPTEAMPTIDPSGSSSKSSLIRLWASEAVSPSLG